MLRSNHDFNETTTRGGPARLRPRRVRAGPAPGRRVLAGDLPAYRAGRRRAGERQHPAAVVRGRDGMSVALPHLIFLTAAALGAVVALGAGTGLLLGAWGI